MDISFNFLLQATRVLYIGNYDESELDSIYHFIIGLDETVLNDYYNTCSILTYSNDLELYLEIVENLIKIFEEKEEYEKCNSLMKKKNLSEIIKSQNTI